MGALSLCLDASTRLDISTYQSTIDDMKKISVYFTDSQYAAIEGKATQVGVTFAEALRRVLDQCFAAPQKEEIMAYESVESVEFPSTPSLNPKVHYAYVILDEDGDKYTKAFPNAYIKHNESNGDITVYRLRKDRGLGRVIAQFSGDDISSWYQDDDDEAEDV
jgi:hypothetical protein